jgi:hypothetical protein
MPDEVRLQSLEAKAFGIILPMGLRVDEVQLTSGPARAETDPFRLFLDQPGRILAIIEETSVAEYLNELAPGGLKGFTVACADEVIRINAIAKILFEVAVEAELTLVVEDERRLMVVLQSAEVKGADARKLVEGQLDRINPIFDVKDFPVPMRIERVEVRDQAIWVHGLAYAPA